MLPTLYLYISVCVCARCMCVCVRCIRGMCGFCLTSSISYSLWQSAGECANCFNWLTTRSRAMESFDRTPLYLHVCLICSVCAEQQHAGDRHLVPMQCVNSGCKSKIKTQTLYQSRVTSAVMTVKSLGYDARKCAQFKHKSLEQTRES